MQPLAQFQIELVDHAGDGKRGCRTQRLLHGPQGLFAVRRLGQDQARRIEAEAVAAMTMQAAVFAQSVGRHHQEQLLAPAGWGKGGKRAETGENRRDETEGRCSTGAGVGHDLMERPAGEATLRQVGIQDGQAKGQGTAQTIRSPGQEAAQFLQDYRATSRHG